MVSQDLLPVRDAFDAIGHKVSSTAIWRYCTAGINGHRLRNWKIGNSRKTTIEEVLKFCEAVGSGSPPPAAAKTSKRHRQQIEAELDRELEPESK
ncbi:MAG: hypothetical protein RLY14_1226 [Planctomycetota bacterium]|jgi:hypothetical protein